MSSDKLRCGGLIQAFYWILFGGTINRLTRKFGKREGKWRELQQQSIEQDQRFELTYTRIMVNHAEYSITSFLHVIVWTDTTEHWGLS